MTQGLATASFVTANAFVRRDALARVGHFEAHQLAAFQALLAFKSNDWRKFLNDVIHRIKSD